MAIKGRMVQIAQNVENGLAQIIVLRRSMMKKVMKPDDMSVETANKAAHKLNEVMEYYCKLDLDTDFAVYLLLTSGVSLLMLNNKYDSMSALRLISAAIRCAEENVEAAEEETQH